MGLCCVGYLLKQRTVMRNKCMGLCGNLAVGCSRRKLEKDFSRSNLFRFLFPPDDASS